MRLGVALESVGQILGTAVSATESASGLPYTQCDTLSVLHCAHATFCALSAGSVVPRPPYRAHQGENSKNAFSIYRPRNADHKHILKT